MFRTTDVDEPTLTYCGDNPDGSINVHCPCGFQFPLMGTVAWHKDVPLDCCPSCKHDLVYPGWAVW